MVVFQTSVCKYIAFGGIKPDVVFVFVISFVVLEKKFSYCLSIAVICGFLIDILGGRGFGMDILSYTYSALICYAIGTHFFKERLLFAVPMVFLATFICEMVFFGLNIRDFYATPLIEAIKIIILPTTIYNTLMTFVIYPLVKKNIYNGNRVYVRVPNARRR